ncbi:lipopolysaccharide heptosyltransferase I [Curvibacter sp. CHRR-16]|nr:lipopolysaccharide heptosyltransferase I [Curvibacter sp. CHRR-16]
MPAPTRPAVQRILIVKLSSLGDVVHAMPAVQDLHRAYPQAQIDWVVERGFAPLVQRCDGVGRVIPCDLRRWRKSWWTAATRAAWRAFKQELQRDAYDAVLDLQGLTKSALVARLARTAQGGKRYALAHRTDGSSYEAPTRWVADEAISMHPHVHAVQRSRQLCAQALGSDAHPAPRFGLRAARTQAPAWLAPASSPFVPAQPVVALVHGTSRADKEWPLAQWVALGQRLEKAGFLVALAHGSQREQDQSQSIAAGLERPVLWPLMPLDDLTDTLAFCAGVIGVDSGVSHIAVALDLPHVQIYNFNTAWRTGPLPDPYGGAARQLSVYAQPTPNVQEVWSAWIALGVPVLPPQATLSGH